MAVFMAVLFTRCLVARQLPSPKLIERERERKREYAGTLKYLGVIKNGQARRHARGEKAPARETHENRFPPLILAAAASSVKNFDRKRLTSHKQSVVHLYPRSKYTYKDQLGYLIIERWSNKTTVNTQLYIVFNKTNNRTESKIGIFKECMLCIRLS